MSSKDKKTVKITKDELKKNKLKETVINILKECPDGLEKNYLWAQVQKAGVPVSAKHYGLSKISDILYKWSDVISVKYKKGRELVMLHKKSANKRDHGKSASASPGLPEKASQLQGLAERKKVSDIDPKLGAVGGKAQKPVVEMFGSTAVNETSDLDFGFDLTFDATVRVSTTTFDGGTQESIQRGDSNDLDIISNKVSSEKTPGQISEQLVKIPKLGPEASHVKSLSSKSVNKQHDFGENNDDDHDDSEPVESDENKDKPISDELDDKNESITDIGTVSDQTSSEETPGSRPLISGPTMSQQLPTTNAQPTQLPGWSQIAAAQNINMLQQVMRTNTQQMFHSGPSFGANMPLGKPFLQYPLQQLPMQFPLPPVRTPTPGHEAPQVKPSSSKESVNHDDDDEDEDDDDDDEDDGDSDEEDDSEMIEGHKTKDNTMSEIPEKRSNEVDNMEMESATLASAHRSVSAANIPYAANLPRFAVQAPTLNMNPFHPLMLGTGQLQYGSASAVRGNFLTGQPLLYPQQQMQVGQISRPVVPSHMVSQTRHPLISELIRQQEKISGDDDNDDDEDDDEHDSSDDSDDEEEEKEAAADAKTDKTNQNQTALSEKEVIESDRLKIGQMRDLKLTNTSVGSLLNISPKANMQTSAINPLGRPQVAPVYVSMPARMVGSHQVLPQTTMPTTAKLVWNSARRNFEPQAPQVPMLSPTSFPSLPVPASVNPLMPIHSIPENKPQVGKPVSQSELSMYPAVTTTRQPVQVPATSSGPMPIPSSPWNIPKKQVVITADDLHLGKATIPAGAAVQQKTILDEVSSTFCHQVADLLPKTCEHKEENLTIDRRTGILKFWDDLEAPQIESIDKGEFERKTIDVRPVYVAPGRQPSKEEVNKVAKECIEMLAESNEFVTQERVEQLVCKRFDCGNVRNLGLRQIDHLDSVMELNRAICKINAYIVAFLKTRSICTLHELKECLREYVPNKGDIKELKIGPLQRFPEIYKQFKFPPNMAEIPPITSMTILDLFDTYLTKTNQWMSRVELEPFMDYLVEKYEADNAYMLGLRLRSLPLAVGVLKKAKRDSANQRREIYAHFKQKLEEEIEGAFSKFKATILQRGDSDDFEIRRHYLKMQPETAIMEISDKLSVLMMIAESNTERMYVKNKMKKAIEDFLKCMRGDSLGKTLLHLAICMTSTSVQEEALELLKPSDSDNDDNAEKHVKQPPRKEAVVESLKKYIKNCLNVRALSLPDFKRMEEKLLEEFGFSEFSQMGYGRFLDFLLRETQKVLEDGGGLQLGSGAGGVSDSETSFRPHQDDLFDFIGQCKECGIIQPSDIEAALCKQYNVKEVRSLGFGNIKLLLNHADKYLRRTNMACMNVMYETPFAMNDGMTLNSESKVGILGHQTKEAAIICLQNCPLMENLAEWSQWSLVFEPQFGSLKNFIQVLKSKNQIKIEGGKFAEIDVMAMEVQPGELIRLVSSTSQEQFTNALRRRDTRATCGHLVSMAVIYKGVGKMPMALLSSHMKAELHQMFSEEPGSNSMFAMDSSRHMGQHNIAAQFVLDCLMFIPMELCVSLANQMFLDPLGQVVGASKSKQLLAQLCVTSSERNHLEKLGCLLGIPDWIAMVQQKFKLSEIEKQTLPPEYEDVIDAVDDIPEVEVSLSDDSDDDFDNILSGDYDSDVPLAPQETANESTNENGIVSLDSNGTKDEKHDDDEVDEEQELDVDVKPDEPVISPCESIINQIRRDEFGVGIQLSEDGERLMKVQQERLGRSLDRLSKDLYSKDTHFVLELIQNADDNSYDDDLLSNQKDDCPAVKFIIKNDGIYVLNNELGFQEKDIRALCDVGRSTKGKHKFGYIGQKGIGFKSVFRVTDAPEVHSNGYHIKFDVNSGPMGYILPHWIPEEEQVDDSDWTTSIILRLNTDSVSETRRLAGRFKDIHPSLLLFLHRLRKITIKNEVEKSETTVRRRDVGNNVIEIQHSDSKFVERFLVVKSTLDASKISSQAKSGADVESTEIALAFPIKQAGQKAAYKVLPPKQPVFAFLPLRSYGFRFIIQGDFDVPSSREDVDRDSSWNQWLRNEIHSVFIDSLEKFKSHPEYNTMDAVCTFLQFVPMEDEVLDFFKPVAADILRKLKGKPCIPTQPNSQGEIDWKIPSQTVRVKDHRIRSIITPELLETHLNLFYLHSDVAANLNPSLMSCLGIEKLSSEHLSKLGCALIKDMGSHCRSDKEVILIAKWLACMYCSLDEFHNEDVILTTLRTHKLLPLSDGELVSLQDKTVFYPIPDSSHDRATKDPFYYLQQDVNSLHPLLLHTGDDEVNSQVHKLLVTLGIKKMSPNEVINHHIIPVLKSDTWEKKSREILLSYMIYIKIQTDKLASVCNLDDVREVAVVLTNHGFKNPSRDCIHFPVEYGNRINLKQDFPGYDWTLLSRAYLPRSNVVTEIMSWTNFFRKLGVEDFLCVRKTDVHISRSDLAKSAWSSVSAVWPEVDDYTVQDNQCLELEKLILENDDKQSYVKQMKALGQCLDQMWDKHYSKMCQSRVLDKDGKPLKDTMSSFSILLQTEKWLPGVKTEIIQSPDGSLHHSNEVVLREPSSLYVRSKEIIDLLADKILYLDARINSQLFLSFLGVKTSVPLETVKENLMNWSSRSKQDVPTRFCTTMVHMKNVYKYLSDNLRRQEFHNLLQICPIFFVPEKNDFQERRGQVIPGHFLNRTEVWMCDNTGLMEKHRALLEDFHSDLSCKRNIQLFYMDRLDLVEIFTQEGNIAKQPSIEEYLELLCLLCSTSTPKDADILHDVYYIFSTIGSIINLQRQGLNDQEAETVLKPLKTKLLDKLRKQKVFPTKAQMWVNLSDKPLIADNKEYEKMFENKEGVHFLDMEIKVPRGRGKVGRSAAQTRVSDSNIQQPMIDLVVEMCGIKKLSDVIDIQTAPEMIQPCNTLQNYFHKIVPTLQQYLMTKHEDVYAEHEQNNTQQMLASAKFYQTKKIEVSYLLKDMMANIVELREEVCSIDPPTFYIQREHLESVEGINKEIARYFSFGDKSCGNDIRSFLTQLSTIISGGSDETVEGLLERYDAEIIEIPEETVWHVEPPFIPVPEPQIVEPEPSQDEPLVENEEETVKVIQTDGTLELRMWPPVANDSGKRIIREGTEPPPSNIWPPPKSMDYMKSVKDLPSNIRVTPAEHPVNKPQPSTESNDLGSMSYAARVNHQSSDSHYTVPPRMQTGTSVQEIIPLTEKAESASQPVAMATGKKNSEVKTPEKENINNSSDSQTMNYEDSKTDEKVDEHNQAVADEEPASPMRQEEINHQGDTTPDGTGDHHAHQHSGGPMIRGHVRHGNSPKREWFAKDDPAWSLMATDYSFDELCSSGELGKYVTVTLGEEAGDAEIGRWGEALVDIYLKRLKDSGKILDFVWKNKETEKGSPYDFEVIYDNQKKSEFIEVKSTSSNNKEIFPISIHQIRFAEEKQDNFHIYRVFNAGNSDHVRLVRVSDLSSRLSSKQVSLFMVI